jgi:mannose-6-phosphate isomerase-like protein (cupin superfamily)/DNA-binding beta-propeller fold protein YncE
MSNLSQWLIVAVAAVAAVFLFGLERKGPEPSLQPAVFDIAQLASQSQEIEEGFYVSPIARTRTGEANFARLEDVSFPMHYHGQSEIAYVLQGEFTLEFADESYRTVGPGELVVISAGVATSVSGSGDILLFSTPPENERDTVWLEGPMAKRGAKADLTRKPDIINVTDRIAGRLDRERAGFRFTVAFESPTGSVELFRIEQGVALHKHPKENHVLYILNGRGKGQIGDQTAEVGPGQIVVIPANVSHKLERIGDEPLDFILFSTPGFHPDDIVWLEEAKTLEPPLLAVVDYTSHTAGEEDGIAIVDVNPQSRTFGNILQRVKLGPNVSPHHLYYNRDGSKLYTTALGGARLYKIELAGAKIKQVTPLDAGPCEVGEDLYFSEDGSRYYLTCMGSHMVAVFDAKTDKMIGRISAPAPSQPFIRYPHGIAVNEQLDRMIVTETVSPDLQDAGSSVTVIELSSGRVLSTHLITKDGKEGSAPVEVIFLSGKPVAYITAMLESTLWAGVWDESSEDFQFKLVDDLTARGQGVPLEMYVGPDGYLYVSFGVPGGVNVYDISDPLAPQFLRTLPADAGAHHIVFSPDGQYMFVQNNLLNLEKMNAGTISAVTLKTGQLVATIDSFVKQGLQPASIVLLGQPEHHYTIPTPAQGFALHIDAKKHINGMPDFVVHHYCKTLEKSYIQCLLFDSDRPNARVIGVETIISPEIYAQLPEEERASWHYHKDEIPLVDAQLPGLSEEEAQKVVAAVENTYGRVVIFWVPGNVAPMGTPSVVTPQSHHASAPREIVIKATDFSFEAPEKIEGGLVTVTMENEGAELHHLQLARLRDGVTFDQVHKVLAEGPEETLFELLEWVGGPSLVSPGGQSRVVLNIPEGQYLLLCFVASPDGVPHFAKGMTVPLTVTASSADVSEPKADVSVILTDFAFTMPAQIKAGKQTWRVTNKGAQPHEIPIARLMPGKTPQDALRFLQAPEGVPPFEYMGGLQAIDSGRTGWAGLDLPPGEYIALCFVPDPASGKAHIELGMIGMFTVK